MGLYLSKRTILLGCFFFTLIGCIAQEVPRDTSYTISSTLSKFQKHYPELGATPASVLRKNPGVKDVVYRTLGNRQLTADIYTPQGGNQLYPGVLLIHGGGWRAGDKSLMAALGSHLAEAGYVVVAPEYRLSLEAPFPAAVYDLKAAVRWMRKNAADLHLDSTQIAAMGCSAGGQLAALIGTTNNNPLFEGETNTNHSSMVNAIIDVDGVLAFHHPDSQEGSMAAQWLGGTYEQLPDVWEQASALSHVDQNTPPTLFIASAYPRFLAGRQEFISVLEEAGTKTETKFMKEAPHSFWLFHPWFDTTLIYIVQFLDEVFD